MRTGRSNWKVLLFTVLGIFLGNVAGQALGPVAPVMAEGAHLAAGPAELNFLGFLSFTLGFAFKINFTGALVGILTAVLGFRI